ncbi:hypothetical protein [Taibaiella soli]|uniref:Tetratricopeptide repeat protein n=1 Tax=Taibaiella soli TaxID=1649169 RepID=A0A2W2BEI0_9BACT|nr:hypothetical protein [Taibaiella soli]PZF74307.1 hypothetical protein DN068_04680 [Taibaiella soli]
MTQPASITNWLKNPETLASLDMHAIKELIHQYPFFAPARMLAAAQEHKTAPFTNPVMQTGFMYSGNRFLFQEMLEHAAGNRRIIMEATPAPSIDPVSDETVNDNKKEKTLIQPIYTEDYFLHQGISVDDNIPSALNNPKQEVHETEEEDDEKSLMRIMSFSEWLMYYKNKNKQKEEEEEEVKARKSSWQKEKLAAALGEENDEIPETVFEMAVNSITKEEGLISESLAEILIKQGKYDKAVEMYRKLSLRNPQKNAYFAQKIEAVLKAKKS